MIRPGHILMKLAAQVETRLPAHLDVLDGAARAGGAIDGRGPVDRAILARAHAFRARRCFHAQQSLTRIGARHVHYNATEQRLGLPQVVTLQLDDPARTEAILDSLRDLDQVAWAMAEPLSCIPFRAPDRGGPGAGAAEMVGVDAALAMEPGSRAVAVAVIDTGVTLEHGEFQGRLRSGYDCVDLGLGRVADEVMLVGDSLGRDFCARDETGHGTHVAGIIGARGLAMQRGAAGRSPIIPIRALAAAQMREGPVFGVGALSDLDAAIKVAVDMGAKVLNMSFGTARSETDPHAPPPHADSIAYAVAEGCIPVAAMGNSGVAEDYYPAALPGCIAVGACTLTGERAAFSTIGPHIALSAPGEAIRSAAMDGYADSSGTSHAAPFVSGAVALLAARAMRSGHDLTLAQARQALCLSATGGAPNPETGWGTLNIPGALRRLDAMLARAEETPR
ncbi:MAG: S8 family peptidase [Gemmobacter sp.]